MNSGFKILSIDNILSRQIRNNILFYDKVYIDNWEFRCINGKYQFPDSYSAIAEIETLIDSKIVELITTFDFFDEKNLDSNLTSLYLEYKSFETSEYANNVMLRTGCPMSAQRMRSKNKLHHIDSDNVNFFTANDFGRDDVLLAQDISSRILSQILSNSLNENIQSVLNYSIKTPFKDKLTTSGEVLSVILNNYPVISSDIPIRELIDFKNDDETKYRYKMFRDFINQLSKGNLNKSEIEDRIEYLLSEYEKQLKVYRLKYSYSSLEAIVIPIIEFIENVAKLNWSKAAKGLFAIGKSEIDFLQSELNFKGREVSYLHLLKDFK